MIGSTWGDWNGTWPSEIVVTSTYPDPAAQKIRVIRPNGGETLHALEGDTLIWFGDNRLPAVKVELNRNFPVGSWEVILDSTANDGIEEVFLTEPLSSECRLRITSISGPKFYDYSDSSWTISTTDGYLALVSNSDDQTPVTEWSVGVHECPEGVSETYFLKNFGTASIVVYEPTGFNGANYTQSHTCDPLFALAPGEMSSCSLFLVFAPLSEGILLDTLTIQTNAVNAEEGFVRIPLSGEQIRTPSSPEIAIQAVEQDARLLWDPIDESVGGCPITTTEYLVFYSEVSEGPFWYHGFTMDTSYVHGRVLAHAEGMYYHVIVSTAPLTLLLGLSPAAQGQPMTEEQVMGILRQHGVAYVRVDK